MCDQNGRLLSYDYPLAEKLKEIVSIYWLPNNLKIHQYAWAHIMPLSYLILAQLQITLALTQTFRVKCSKRLIYFISPFT